MSVERAREMELAEINLLQQNLTLVGQVVEQMPLRDYLRAVDRSEVVAPILDPTLFMAGRDRLKRFKELARTALAFQDEWAQLQGFHAPGRPTSMSLPRSPERWHVIVSGRKAIRFRTQVAAKGFADQMRAAGKTVRIKEVTA